MKICPFCNFKRYEILKQNKYAILTLAKAPYTKYHLLVVPKKHVTDFNSLTQKQKDAVEVLICYALKKLYKKYKNVSVLYRQGDKDRIGKSIAHVHYHIIPNMVIGSKDIKENKRKIYSDKQCIKEAKQIKKRLKT